MRFSYIVRWFLKADKEDWNLEALVLEEINYYVHFPLFSLLCD